MVLYLRPSILSGTVVLDFKAAFAQVPDVTTRVSDTLFASIVFAFPAFPSAAAMGAFVYPAVYETGVAKCIFMFAGYEFPNSSGFLVTVVVAHLEIGKKRCVSMNHYSVCISLSGLVFGRFLVVFFSAQE